MRWGKTFGTLNDARVVRGGRNGKYLEWEGPGSRIKLDIVHEIRSVVRDEDTPNEREEKLDGIAFTSEISSKGGGVTVVSLWIPTSDFKMINEAMSAVTSETTNRTPVED